MGSSAPPIPVIEGTQKLGIKLIPIYELTEVYSPSSICAEQLGWNELPPDAQVVLKRRQGVPYPLQEAVTVLDLETMQEVPRDASTMDEVMFRGNAVMKGYLKNEKATAEAFSGGWFRTGDLGVIDEHGYIIIKNRSKDIIIPGGENISSVEFADVQASRCVAGRSCGKARLQMGWSAVRLHRAEGRHQRHRQRDHRLLPRTRLRVQDAEGRGIRAAPEDIDGQDPEIHAA